MERACGLGAGKFWTKVEKCGFLGFWEVRFRISKNWDLEWIKTVLGSDLKLVWGVSRKIWGLEIGSWVCRWIYRCFWVWRGQNLGYWGLSFENCWNKCEMMKWTWFDWYFTSIWSNLENHSLNLKSSLKWIMWDFGCWEVKTWDIEV